MSTKMKKLQQKISNNYSPTPPVEVPEHVMGAVSIAREVRGQPSVQIAWPQVPQLRTSVLQSLDITTTGVVPAPQNANLGSLTGNAIGGVRVAPTNVSRVVRTVALDARGGVFAQNSSSIGTAPRESETGGFSAQDGAIGSPPALQRAST